MNARSALLFYLKCCYAFCLVLCCHRREKGGVGLMQVPGNNGKQIKSNLGQIGEISDSFVRHKNISTQSYLHYVRGRGRGVSGIYCVCRGRGGRGLKGERKGDSERLKKKWRKGGGDCPRTVSPIFFFFFKPHHSTFERFTFTISHSE